jgi:hypothetical protein
MRHVSRLALAGACLSFAAASLLLPRGGGVARGSPSAVPGVLALVTPIDGTETSLVVSTSTSSTPLASFEHLAGAVVRGVALADGSVAAIADGLPRRDRSWASVLVRLRAGEAATVLATDLAHASRPVLDGQGGVLIERGAAGELVVGEDGKLRMRVDAIAVERVDVASGATTQLYSGSGYTAHVAGVLGGEVVLYRVGPGGADLVAVSLATQALRTVVPSWPAAARDFSVDSKAGTLVVQQADPAQRTNVLERVDVKTGARTVLATAGDRDLVPFVLPTGGVAFTPEGGIRSRTIGAGPEIPLAAGAFFWGRASSDGGGFVTGLVVPPRSLPSPVVVSMATGAVTPLVVPPDARVEIAGFVGGAP